MIRILPVGSIAAYLQAVWAIPVTLIFLLRAQQIVLIKNTKRTNDENISVVDFINSHSIHLRYSYLIAAIFVLLLFKPYFETFYDSIWRNVSRISQVTPKKELKIVAGHLTVSAICLAIGALQAPSQILVIGRSALEPSWVSTALWSGLLSVAAASLGANAIAARCAQ